MPKLPDFSRTSYFPPFSCCPPAEDPCSESTTFLLGTVQIEATLSLSPTFICKDRMGQEFAVTMRLPPIEIKAGQRGGGYDVSSWKRGYCVVIRNARRTGVTESKQGYVAITKEDVWLIPASAEKLIQMSQSEAANDVPEYMDLCHACGAMGNVCALRACKGCKVVWYCGKDCQIRGWGEMGHRTECKIRKAVTVAFSSETSSVIYS